MIFLTNIYDQDGNVLDTSQAEVTPEEAEKILDLACELALLRRCKMDTEDFLDRLADAVEDAGLV